MHRVMFALAGLAVAFSALAFWLEPGRGRWSAEASALGAFVAVLAVGFPVLYYCCKRGLWEVWRFTVLVALVGGLCALPFYGGPFRFPFLLAIFVLAGALFGLAFWLAAIWRNDDLTCPKSFCLPCGKAYRVARAALLRR
jgi:hypothetical protein